MSSVSPLSTRHPSNINSSSPATPGLTASSSSVKLDPTSPVVTRTTTASNRALEGLKKFFLCKEFLYSLGVGVAVVACFYSPLAALVGKIGLLNTLLVGGGVLLGSAIGARYVYSKNQSRIQESRESHIDREKADTHLRFVTYTEKNGSQKTVQIHCKIDPQTGKYILPLNLKDARFYDEGI